MVWVREGRKPRILRRFFSGMSREQGPKLEAVVMGMWVPSIVAVGTRVPHLKRVFDLFHVVARFSRIIDKTRQSGYRKASKAKKAVFKGATYLFLRERSNIGRLKDRRHRSLSDYDFFYHDSRRSEAGPDINLENPKWRYYS